MITMNGLYLSTIRSGKGDCIRINYDKHNIIVDSGSTSTAGEFRRLCYSIISAGEQIDALFISHYDDDHIGGILKFGTAGIKNIYFNAYDGAEENSNLTAVQNQRLFHLMPETIAHTNVMAGDVIEFYDAKITIHSPTCQALMKAKEKMKEADVRLGAVTDWRFTLDKLMERPYSGSDTSISNQSSIVFTLEYKDQKILFSGDAWPENIPGGKYDLVKLPHHGSIRNISEEWLSRLDAHAFLICANGTEHPNKQTIAKLLQKYGVISIYGNYDWWMKDFLCSEDMKYIHNGRLIFKMA